MTTRDRLPELMAAQTDEEDMAVVLVMSDSSHMEDFFLEVQQIRQIIDRMQENVEEVKITHSSILISPQSDDRLIQKLNDLMADMKIMSIKSIERLKLMQRKIKSLEEINFVNAEYRIRKTQHSMLLQKFIDVMTDYNKTQTHFWERYKARILRDREIRGIVISDEEVEQMIETGNTAIFVPGIITETQLTKQSLAEIEARHKDIIKLEKSITELHDMFMDMTMLLENQGEMIDRIEFQVEESQNLVSSGKIQTQLASKHISKYRKKKIILIIILLVLLTALITYLVTQFA